MRTLDLPKAPIPRSGQQRAYWQKLSSQSVLALAALERARNHSGPVVIVTADSHSANVLEQSIATLGPNVAQAHFPDWETLPYDLFSPHPEIISQRIACLARLPQFQQGVLIVPVTTLMQRIAPPKWIAGNVLQMSKGEKFDLEAQKKRLSNAGYRHVPQVNDPGDFAVRGGLMDLFPSGLDHPVRIELFDDEIESIRFFDPETQRSLESVEKIDLLPAREFPFDESGCKLARETLIERFDVDYRRSALMQDLKECQAPAGVEYYLPLFFDKTASILDYLPANSLLVLAEQLDASCDRFWQQTRERYEQRRHDIERPILAPDELYLSPEALRARLNEFARSEVCEKDHPRFAEAEKLAEQPAPDLPISQKGESTAAALISFLSSYSGRVLIAADSAGRRETLMEILHSAELRPQVMEDWTSFIQSDHPFAIAVAPLDDGFALDAPQVCVLTERQFFPERAEQSRRRKSRSTRDPESIIRDLNDIQLGAPIVHIEHGVGRYLGLQTLESGGITGEFLCIEYAKGDKLYVPVAQLEQVSRYAGTAPEHAPLHSLGSDAWEKARKRAAEKVRDVAAELLQIQARRQSKPGLVLRADRSMYEPFAAAFPFEETPDQLSSIEAVIADMAKPQPMDRVVCGDVGFGKTEVAVRAAFVAATAGKQVAVLVPTTLLAEQHFRNFSDRFADWPLRVEVLSRFKSAKEIKAALESLAQGRIDIIVGTHRLLQADVNFKDLGLVIVDEEQRFGVRQKEKLKSLRAEVHLLTLTATPIPRTLNMAMSGLRDLSIIATPPAHRIAVKTFVSQWESALVREACQRELARGGQIYFLHNEVESIDKFSKDIAELVPEARVRYAHGQMPERELEQVMLDFHRQRFNLLVCTTIIESGIDIPSANTILINRADKFGLAQLHQLRGRVGRSHHRAYAYLLVPPKLTGDAEKRLEALASIEDLGAGFVLATHDLEIRGAGELLGDDQSGQIAEIGFSLYTELLERAVQSIKDGKVPDVDIGFDQGVNVNLHLAALIPDDYLPDVHARLTMYKRIASAKNEDSLRELQIEMIDRFGLLPEAVKNLFAVSELKLKAKALGILKIDLGVNGGHIVFDPKPKVDPMSLIRLIQSQPKHYSLNGPERLKITLDLAQTDVRIKSLRGLLSLLSQ